MSIGDPGTPGTPLTPFEARLLESGRYEIGEGGRVVRKTGTEIFWNSLFSRWEIIDSKRMVSPQSINDPVDLGTLLIDKVKDAITSHFPRGANAYSVEMTPNHTYVVSYYSI